MSTFYQYTSPEELVADLLNEKKVYFEKGMVANITVASKKPNEDGFIMIYAYNYNSIFQNVSRYSYTLTQFRQLTFSQESVGLYYYLTIDPANVTTNWTQNHISDAEKAEYIRIAYNLLKQNFVPRWLLEWNLVPIPSPIIKVLDINNINIPNNHIYRVNDTTVNVANQFKFKIKNIGTARLDIASINSMIIDSDPGEILTVTNINDSLMPNVDEVEITVNTTLSRIGTRLLMITINSNDPLQNIFVFSIEIDVQATPAPIGLITYQSTEQLIFTPSIDFTLFPELATPRELDIEIKNNGNAVLEITNITFSNITLSYNIYEYNFEINSNALISLAPNEIRKIKIEYQINYSNTNFQNLYNTFKTDNPTEVLTTAAPSVVQIVTNSGILTTSVNLFVV